MIDTAGDAIPFQWGYCRPPDPVTKPEVQSAAGSELFRPKPVVSMDGPNAGSHAGKPREHLLELLLFCTAGIAVTLIELLFARLAARAYVRGVLVRTFPAADWPSWSLVVAIGLALGACGLIAFTRHRRGSQPSVIDRLKDHRVAITVVSFFVGTLIAAIIRFYLGYIYVSEFATGCAPIVAGILVGVIVAGIDDDGVFPWHRQLALMYLLLGSLATALGTIPAPAGWFWGCLFLIIFGSLAASACLIVDIVLNRSSRT